MSIVNYLKTHYAHFEWRALLRVLKKLKPETFIFRAHHSLGFSAREVQDFRVLDDGFEVTANFLGLQGAATPLPLHFSELIVQDDPEESNLHEFLNFFNHQFYRALAQIDEKYAYLMQYQAGQKDVLSQGLMNMAGFLPAQDGAQQELNGQLFLGLRYFVGGRFSKQGLCVYLQNLFALKKVELRECVARAIEIPVEQQACLGVGQVALAEDLILGARVNSVSLHFELHIFVEDVDAFLPGMPAFENLKKIMDFVLAAPLFVTLVVHATRVPGLVLREGALVQLGYNSALSVANDYEYCVRFLLVG